MTVFQIVMVVLMSVGFAVALGFAIAFVVEACKTKKPVIVTPQQAEEENNVDEYDIREMLAQLEEEANNAKAQQEEVAAEEVEEPASEVENVEPVVEEVQEPSIEEPVVEEVEEVSEDETEPAEEEVTEEPQEETEEPKETPKTIVIKEVTTETVGTDFDYNVRLAKIVESKNKMEKELQKTKRAILKYERTSRRRARNQKMLDRRAVELTNLNLLMYSVTDIKNIDADKKAKQEELTKHIAELKASIQDADAFLAKNKERYEHDKKMFAFYTKEQHRYEDEIKELEILIKNANSVTGSTTTTTTETID